MKLLINCSNIKIGGGIQVALSFIYETKKFVEHAYIVVAHDKVYNQIDTDQFSDNYTFIQQNYDFNKKSYRFLDEIEKEHNPDVVFSVFGPSYWTPQAPHLMGFARGHAIYPNSLYRKQLGLINRIIFDVKNKVLMYYTKKNANSYVVETESAKASLSALLPSSKTVYCVSNTYSDVYNIPSLWMPVSLPEKKDNEFWLIHICANYAHKNLAILPQVITHLNDLDKKREYKILLSIDESQLKMTEEQKKHFIFLGKLDVNQCPTAYQAADTLLMTSLIETFSASFLEAMKMKLPILASGLNFAYDICGDAAVYFDPLDAKNIAENIKILASDEALKQDLIDLGTQRLHIFPSSEERAGQYVDICKKLIK